MAGERVIKIAEFRTVNNNINALSMYSNQYVLHSFKIFFFLFLASIAVRVYITHSLGKQGHACVQ